MYLGSYLGTYLGEPVPDAPIGNAGWYGLLGILQTARDEAQHPRLEDCPNDGTPYKTGPNGELFCPFDGYRPGAHA